MPPQGIGEHGQISVPLNQIFEMLAGRITGVDIAELRRLIEPLRELRDAIHRERALSIDELLRTEDELSPTEYLLDHYPGTQLMIRLNKYMTDVAKHIAETYVRFEAVYDQRVQQVLEQQNPQPAALAQAYDTVHRLWADATMALQEVLITTPEALGRIHKAVVHYNKYIRDRFIKGEQKDKGPGLLFILDDEEHKAAYVKIKLVEENPLLTDTLLLFAEDIPRYSERVVKQKEGDKKVREVSRVAINTAIDRMLGLADQRLLRYLQHPEELFTEFSRKLTQLYELVEALKPAYKKILNDPFAEIIVPSHELLQKLRAGDYRKLLDAIQRLSITGFDQIKQEEEDYLPENRREKDHFELRDKLLTKLDQTIKDLASISPDKRTERHQHAEKVVLEAIDLQTHIDDILTSQIKRRLRKDKEDDNEYYTGKQRHPGAFYFAREPAPRTKIDEVIGASFTTAKTHLNEIIETAQFPHVMRLSAPGGRVRSNILLIGPYGCGKTELAKAVCADKRVIGASVSVAGSLTAYMHESVNNVKRIYDGAKELFVEGRELKPVVLALDEFDGWFARDGLNQTDIDMQQIHTVMLQVLDGMEDYNGIVTMAMTNEPLKIPKGIIRRYRYVDIVGELTEAERADMLKQYLGKTLPLAPDVPEHYTRWAQQLQDAVGDVVRKVPDEIHFNLMRELSGTQKQYLETLQRRLALIEREKGENDDDDIQYLKHRLAKYRLITVADVDSAITQLLVKPNIRMQINVAKKTYAKAHLLMDELSKGSSTGFGINRTKDDFFDSSIDDE